MKNPKIIIVTGSERSGTSMTMNMLKSGGVLVQAEDHKYFNNPYQKYLPASQKFLLEHCLHRGVKILNIHEQNISPIPGVDFKVIMCLRDPQQQTLSKIKLVQKYGPEAKFKPANKAKLLSEIPFENDLMMAASEKLTKTVLELRFEETLRDPFGTAQKIRNYIDKELNLVKMVECIQPRSPKCGKKIFIC